MTEKDDIYAMHTEAILEELRQAVSGISEEAIQKAVKLIINAGQIFCDGIGRSGLSCRAFAMRLMHLGCKSYFVGDTITTAIQEGDLLITCSKSGESKALISRAEKAKNHGAKVLAVTASPESTLGKLADEKLIVEARKNKGDKGFSIMPMGSMFEGGSWLLFENLVLMLMKAKNETNETMVKRHANLE